MPNEYLLVAVALVTSLSGRVALQSPWTYIDRRASILPWHAYGHPLQKWERVHRRQRSKDLREVSHGRKREKGKSNCSKEFHNKSKLPKPFFELKQRPTKVWLD